MHFFSKIEQKKVSFFQNHQLNDDFSENFHFFRKKTENEIIFRTRSLGRILLKNTFFCKIPSLFPILELFF